MYHPSDATSDLSTDTTIIVERCGANAFVCGTAIDNGAPNVNQPAIPGYTGNNNNNNSIIFITNLAIASYEYTIIIIILHISYR